MKRFRVIGGILLCLLMLTAGSAAAGPLLQRTAELQPTEPAKPSAAKVKPRPKRQAQLAAVPRRPFIPMAELKVAAGVSMSMPTNPAGSGEFPTQFLGETNIPAEYLTKPHLYLPFRWRPKKSGVKAVEWQVCRNPSTGDLQDWQYPPELLARGRSTSVPPAADREAYLVIDFRPIYDLPPGFTYPRPLPPHRPSARPSASVRPKTTAMVALSPALQLKYQQKSMRFARAVANMTERRSHYVRLVLLDANGKAVGLSPWVRVRTGEPSQIEIYADALPDPIPAPDVTPPEIRLTRYSGPKYFSYDDQHYRFVVLGNVPSFIRSQLGWNPGDKLFLKPKRDDGGWLDKVGDALGAAFEAFGDFVNWLSKTWDDLKMGLINAVCNDNADCAKYALPVLNTGLTCLGIPPDLPNFNELTSMGADYLAAYVATQTGLPEEGVRIGLEEMGDLVNHPPGGSGSFLWPDPDYQDTPAVIWIEVHNPGAEPTDPVALHLKYGTLCGDACSNAPNLPTFLDTVTPIPPLRPGQRLEIPVFLTENPEIRISHGADRSSTYYDRPIIIYDDGGQVRFSSSAKWHQHEVVNSH